MNTSVDLKRTTSVVLKRTTIKERHFIVTREYDSPTTFYQKYHPKWWLLKESIEDGKIPTYRINGRNRINVVEAIQVLWPNATYEIVAEPKGSDLFK
jgi:hypothetical protein